MIDVPPELATLATRLAEVAARNTAGLIADRLQANRAGRKAEDRVNELEELISSLLADKNELVQIANAYEEQVVAQRISDRDIEYITNELVPLLEHLSQLNDNSDPESTRQVIDLMKPLISTQTVTILQLLGFNFRRAIGEPLTELVRSLISSRTQAGPEKAQELQLQVVRRESLLFEILKDPEAYSRFMAFQNSSS